LEMNCVGKDNKKIAPQKETGGLLLKGKNRGDDGNKTTLSLAGKHLDDSIQSPISEEKISYAYREWICLRCAEARGLCAWVTCVVGLVFTLAAANATADTSDARILMQPKPGADYILGHYYLIPHPFIAVKDRMEQGFATEPGLRGFQLRDDTAALLDMEFYWVRVGARHLAALREALATAAVKQATPVLEQALKAGVIAREEHTAFLEAISSQQAYYAKDTLKTVPFVAQSIARWSFHRLQGKSRAQQIDYGTVMDLSLLVDTPPLTLVWYGGTATKNTRKFSLMSCMTGVTCFPDPHIEQNTRTVEHLDPVLKRYVDGVASRMQALAPACTAGRQPAGLGRFRVPLCTTRRWRAEAGCRRFERHERPENQSGWPGLGAGQGRGRLAPPAGLAA
ncbi:hypothetical protein ACTVNK_15350, partial [Serratia nevei]